MMEGFSLPPELERLERRLQTRERPQLSPQAKQRFLCSVRGDLCRSQARNRWAFAATLAASVLVWLNLSLCATQATDCRLDLEVMRQPMQDGAAQVQQLLPDLPPREAARQAILLRASSGVVPCPRLPANNVALRKSDLWRELLD